MTVSIPGRIIADLLSIRNIDNIPHYAGMPIKNDSSAFVLETTKNKVALPKEIFRDTGKKLLIIDSAVVTGDTLQNLIKILIDNGFKKTNIKSASILATDLAIKSEKGLDYYYYTAFDTNYNMPWGKLYRG